MKKDTEPNKLMKPAFKSIKIQLITLKVNQKLTEWEPEQKKEISELKYQLPSINLNNTLKIPWQTLKIMKFKLHGTQLDGYKPPKLKSDIQMKNMELKLHILINF